LDFSNNQIREIHPNLFNGLTNLNKINFANNHIREIHPDLFRGLIYLKDVNFRNNEIEEIHPNLYNANIKIELFGNRIFKRLQNAYDAMMLIMIAIKILN